MPFDSHHIVALAFLRETGSLLHLVRIVHRRSVVTIGVFDVHQPDSLFPVVADFDCVGSGHSTDSNSSRHSSTHRYPRHQIIVGVLGVALLAGVVVVEVVEFLVVVVFVDALCIVVAGPPNTDLWVDVGVDTMAVPVAVIVVVLPHLVDTAAVVLDDCLAAVLPVVPIVYLDAALVMVIVAVAPSPVDGVAVVLGVFLLVETNVAVVIDLVMSQWSVPLI